MATMPFLNCSTIIFGDSSPVAAMNISPSPESGYPESFTSSTDSSQGSVAMNDCHIQISTTHQLQYGLFGGQNKGKPFLKILEEPVEKFRFRYKSEMMGTHGSILARSSEKNRRKTYPSVQLCNYHGPAVIRCSLYTAHVNVHQRTPHTHRLVVRAENNSDKDDPHEVLVSQDCNYTAIFPGMGIIHTAKKHIVEELVKKKRIRMLEKVQAKNINITGLSTIQEANIRLEAEREQREMNLNSVSLCFEAFIRDSNNCLQEICQPAFSKAVNNMKSALTGELKICRIDKHVSSCMGGEEVFILVEKVGKKNIQIKFFEVDDEDNEIWYDYGKFSELDVHHQYAIVFRTPPYRDLEIDKNVDVFVQLYRPTDGDRSEPIKFQYKPSDKMGRTRKRPRVATEMNPIIMDQSNKLPLNPDHIMNGTAEPLLAHHDSDLFTDMITDNQLNSSEFKEFLKNLSISDYLSTFTEEPADLAFDGESRTASKRRKGKQFASLQTEKPEVSHESDFEVEVKKENDIDALVSNCLSQLEAIMKEKPPPEMLGRRVEEIFNDKTEEGDNALHAAIIGKEKDALKRMLNVLGKGQHVNIINCPNVHSEIPLHLAVLQNDPELVKMLISRGADPNAENKNGDSSIHLTVEHSHDDCLDEILRKTNYLCNENKPKCNEKNNSGRTPLHLAVLKHNLGALKKLVEAGGSVNEEDSTLGRTVLHLAVEENCKAIVEYLVKETTIDVNKPNFEGHIALHLACVINGGALDICTILLESKSDPLINNYESRRRSTSPSGSESKIQMEDKPTIEIKEEIESEDELKLAMDDDDDDDDDDDEDSQGHTSIDLAWNNKEILKLLTSNQLEPTTSIKTEVKEECQSPSNESTKESENGLFDEYTLQIICDRLDATKNWEKLADFLDYGFLVPSIKNASSPSKLLLSYTDLHGNATVNDIRNFLEVLSEKEAMEALDLMLAKKVAGNPLS